MRLFRFAAAEQPCRGAVRLKQSCSAGDAAAQIDRYWDVTRPSWRMIGSRISSGNANMFKKRSAVQWVSFCIVFAMVIGLLWLARYLEKASF